MAAANARGDFVAPLFIQSGKKVNVKGAIGWPGALLAATDNGSMEQTLFFEWAKEFVAATKSSETNRSALILDNHGSHLFFAALKYLKDNGVTVIALPPNTTAYLCPLDVAFFGPFKSAFEQAVSDIREFRGSLSLVQIINCCKTAFDKVSVVKHFPSENRYEANIIQGFRKCGFYPLDRNQPLQALDRDLAPDADGVAAPQPQPITPHAAPRPIYPPGSDEAKQLLADALEIGQKKMENDRARQPGQGKIITADAHMQMLAQKAVQKDRMELDAAVKSEIRKQNAADNKEKKEKAKKEKAEGYDVDVANGVARTGRPPKLSKKRLKKSVQLTGKKRKRSKSPRNEDSGEDIRAADVSVDELDE